MKEGGKKGRKRGKMEEKNERKKLALWKKHFIKVKIMSFTLWFLFLLDTGNNLLCYCKYAGLTELDQKCSWCAFVKYDACTSLLVFHVECACILQGQEMTMNWLLLLHIIDLSNTIFGVKWRLLLSD